MAFDPRSRRCVYVGILFRQIQTAADQLMDAAPFEESGSVRLDTLKTI
jgi:hypothetical protein